MDLSLDEFLMGIFAVLAYEGRASLRLEPGILDASLRQTLEVLEKHMKRERIAPQFRLTADAAAKKGSALNKSIKHLVLEHIVKPGDSPEQPARIVWPRDAAYKWLATTPFPIGFFERAAKVFWKQHETARIRVSLHRLATRGKKPG